MTTSATRKANWDAQTLIWLGVVSFCAIVTKFYRLDNPPETAFDEVHFGKFASFYIRREYFFDVHPPLGKLLFAAVGYLFGYDGSFNFETIGLSYKDTNVPYVEMRGLSAFCGALTVIAIYAMLIEMKFSLPAAIVGACMIAFGKSNTLWLGCLMILLVYIDNALTTQSRFILLDSQLIFFIIMTCFSWVKFRSQTDHPFTAKWWAWLTLTGTFIGLSLGVKLIGLLITATIGICTIRDLWDVSNIKKTRRDITVLYHWLARVLCLIVLPIILFIIPYWIHFEVANRSGEGEKFMSSEFQSTLKGSPIRTDIRTVYYGSVIKIKNEARKSFLHSHNHNYPHKHSDGKISSQGQQVTGYHHSDFNNDWKILPEITDPPVDYVKDTRIPVKDGDYIRLQHMQTGKYLLTHDVASPLTITNQEVTAVKDANETSERYPGTIWQIRINKGDQTLKAKTSIFQLNHAETDCNLLTSADHLPQWGFKQLEVNAAKVTDHQTLWFIESTIPEGGWREEELNFENKTSENDKEKVHLPFSKKLTELIKLSLEHNAKLVDYSPYNAPPSKWPLMVRGTSFWHSKDDREKVFLLGNPFAWYIALLSLPIYIGLFLADLYSFRREKRFLTDEQRNILHTKGAFFLLAYVLHYVPFFFMGRALYFHHYLPSYLFSALIFTSLYEILALKYRILKNDVVVGVLCGLIMLTFFHFSCLCYGMNHHKSYFQTLQWVKTWHFTD